MNFKKPPPLSFETERFLIRRYEPSDAELLYQAARSSIPEVFKFLPWCHPDYSFEDSVKWLELVVNNWREGAAHSFAIFDKDEHEFHGGCGINQIDEHPVGNLGYWIKTSSTGKGVATEATIALTQFAFEHIGLKRIEIMMSVMNPGSRLVAEKSGAVYEGRLRNRIALHDAIHDAYLYSIIPEDLEDQS